MDKIIARAVPVTEKTYFFLAKIIHSAEYMPGYREKFRISPEWKGSVICLDELGGDLSLDDLVIKNAPKKKPYFIEVNGALLVTEYHPFANFWFYPVVGNVKGFEYDSYTEPSDQECLFKITSTKDEDRFVEGLYFIEDAGSIEFWDDGSIDILATPW